MITFFFFQAEDGIRDYKVTGVQTCALPIYAEEPGDEPVVTEIEGWPVGLTICYDLRFPELYRILALEGALLFTVPAHFTLYTGKDHWELLLRARAVENQCFVAAATQIGETLPGRQSFGRASIVDPWGIVLAQAPDEETVISA